MLYPLSLYIVKKFVLKLKSKRIIDSEECLFPFKFEKKLYDECIPRPPFKRTYCKLKNTYGVNINKIDQLLDWFILSLFSPSWPLIGQGKNEGFALWVQDKQSFSNLF